MKNIEKFLLVIFIFLAGIIAYNQTLAYTPSFSNLQITNIYDTHAEALKLTFILNNINSGPSQDYYIKVSINGNYYTSDLVYDTSIGKMYSFMTIPIAKSNLKNYYYMNYYVVRNSGNVHEYSQMNYKVLLSSDPSGLNWGNTKLVNTYDSAYRKMKLTFSLSNITSNPNLNYYMKLKFNNRDYTSDVIYDSGGKKLYAFFSIDVNKADLKNYYIIGYSVINNNTNTLVYNKSSYKLNIVNNENISWSSMTTSNFYDKDNQNLEIDFNLNNIQTKPSNNYSIKLNFGNTSNTTYNSDLIYDPSNNKLSTSFLVGVNTSDLRNYYYISYTVYDSNNVRIYTKTSYQITVSNYYYNNLNYNNNLSYNNTYYNTNSNCYNNNTGYYSNGTYYYCNTDCSNNNAGYYSNNVYYTCNNNNTYYNDNNISWSNLRNTNIYDSSNRELNLDFYVSSIYTQPQDSYYIKIYLNGTYYTSYFSYESSNNQLHASFNIYLDNSYASTSYYMSYNIIDDYSNTTKYSNTATIYVTNLNNYNNNYDNNYDNNCYYKEGYYYCNGVYYKNDTYNNNCNNNYNNSTYYNNSDYYYSNGVYHKNNTTNYNTSINNSTTYNTSDSYDYAWNRINVIEANHYNSADRKYYINKEIDYLRNSNTYESNFKNDAINIFTARLNNY